MKAEMEVAMKLLEKDIHEKQDTIISLRKQLEDIKTINLEMYRKLQVSFKHWLILDMYFGSKKTRKWLLKFKIARIFARSSTMLLLKFI